MAILTYINNLPLFSSKNEALVHGASSSPRLTGYHTHVYEGIIGYMAGRAHPGVAPKDKSNDIRSGNFAAINKALNPDSKSIELERFYSELTSEQYVVESSINIELNNLKERLNRLLALEKLNSSALDEKQKEEIKLNIETISVYIDKLIKDKEENKIQLDYIQSLTLNEFDKYIRGEKVEKKPAPKPIVLNPKPIYDRSIATISTLVNSSVQVETKPEDQERLNDLQAALNDESKSLEDRADTIQKLAEERQKILEAKVEQVKQSSDLKIRKEQENIIKEIQEADAKKLEELRRREREARRSSGSYY